MKEKENMLWDFFDASNIEKQELENESKKAIEEQLELEFEDSSSEDWKKNIPINFDWKH